MAFGNVNIPGVSAKELEAARADTLAAVQNAIGRLKLEIMTNELTLPLATASGEDLLTASGAPIQAVYHPQK